MSLALSVQYQNPGEMAGLNGPGMTGKQWRVLMLKTVLVILLLGCFGYQVKDSVIKFLRRQMTMALSTTTVEHVTPPVISFCPGFKQARPDYTADDRLSEFYQLLEKKKGAYYVH